jgi:hypothetical protein
MQITPHPEVKCSQAICIEEIAARHMDIRPMELSILFNTFKNIPNLLDYEAENGTELIEVEETGLKAKIFEKLERKYLVEDFGDGQYGITTEGIEIIEKIKNRLETRIGVKQGHDLFPDYANIPELKKTPQNVLNEPKKNIIINQNPKTNMETTKSESELQENHDKMLDKHIAEYNDKKSERQRNRERESSEAKVEVIKYSERAIALKGEGTRKIKDDLKTLGGKFNRYLKSENGIFAGWIFSVKKLNEVTELLKMKGV